ncbi:MAG: hypothetical protein WBN40_02270, partial [Pseudomonadales bacterium]
SSVVLHYDYRLTPHTTAVLSTDFSRTDFTSDDKQDDYSGASLFFEWRATPALQLRFGGGYEQEEAETGPNYYNGYGSLGFRYQLLDRKS